MAAVIRPGHLELLHFTPWAPGAATAAPGDRYEVLHLSAPERDRLRRGRQW